MDQPWSGRKLHFVGIGGAGMSGLAVVAHALGASVTGSDRAAGSPYGGPLKAAGIEPAIGHDAANVPAGAEVVYSSAIAPDNPERTTGAPELHRADLLGELTRLKPTIAISGTHGKTTTSSMLVHALRGAGADPSYLVGGEVRSTGANAGWGTGEWLVVEADESDRSLLKLSPGHRGRHQRRTRPPHHLLLAARRGRHVPRVPRARRPAGGLGPAGAASRSRAGATVFDAPDPMLTATGSSFAFDGLTVTLTVPGAHNARNAAAALTAVKLAGADVERAAARAGDLRRRRPPLRARGDDTDRRARRRRLRPPPDRGPRHDRGRPHARAAARRRALPAAPVLAHATRGRRVRQSPRRRGPRRDPRRLPRTRACRRLPRRHRQARGRRRRRRPRRASPGCARTPTPRRSCGASCARGICC